MDDLQPIGPTRHYVIVCHDGRRIDVDAESMWPSGSCLEFWATVEVIGPRQVCVRRIASSDSGRSSEKTAPSGRRDSQGRDHAPAVHTR
jgi:hypothetical protein